MEDYSDFKIDNDGGQPHDQGQRGERNSTDQRANGERSSRIRADEYYQRSRREEKAVMQEIDT